MQEMIVDSFAGGGGASTGIKIALGRSPDVAIDHDAAALAIHRANHPETRHIEKNIWDVAPSSVTLGRPLGLLWASPDCRHFSKAKGSASRDRNVRDLAWVVVRWAEEARPRVIILENVEEFRTWGPVCERGHPIREFAGITWEAWIKRLRGAGYSVQWRELRACDYGAPTIRKRLFIVARRDGRRIVWPRPTHGAPDSPGVRSGKMKPWRTAARIIDWSLPCPSIFDTADEIMAKHGLRAVRPLADNTLRRIARGIVRYVVKTPRCLDIGAPLGTQVAGGAKHALVTAFLAQHNTGMIGHRLDEPVSTIVGKGCTQALVTASLSTNTTGPRTGLVAAFLTKYYGTGDGAAIASPMHTYTTKDRFGLVTVEIDAATYAVTDIGMRMLTPRERFRAQGFPDSYRIEEGVGADGTPLRLTLDAQGRMCGNSVCPPIAAALVAANCADMAVTTAR